MQFGQRTYTFCHIEQNDIGFTSVVVLIVLCLCVIIFVLLAPYV